MRFGLVFIDPPYALWERPEEGQGIFDLVSALGSGGESLLENDAIAVVRYRTHKVELPESLGSLWQFNLMGPIPYHCNGIILQEGLSPTTQGRYQVKDTLSFLRSLPQCVGGVNKDQSKPHPLRTVGE